MFYLLWVKRKGLSNVNYNSVDNTIQIIICKSKHYFVYSLLYRVSQITCQAWGS